MVSELVSSRCAVHSRAPGIGADNKCDTSAKVDWTVNTHHFDQILAGKLCGRLAHWLAEPRMPQG